MKTTFKTYRFRILDKDGKDTGDTMRSVGRNVYEAVQKALKDPDLKPGEQIGTKVQL